MTITKEIRITKIETVFSYTDDCVFPSTQAKGKIILLEDGLEIADLQSFRFNAKNCDENMEDQPDIYFKAEKIVIDQNIKNILKNAHDQHITQDIKEKFKTFKEKNK